MSSLTMTGKIHHISDTKSGVSKADKEWIALEFVIDTNAEYNPLIAFKVFGEKKVKEFQEKNHKLGDIVDVSFNLSSREHEGRYYTSADMWKIDSVVETEPAQEIDEDLGF